MDAKEVMQQLRAPFTPDEIEWRVDRGIKTSQGNFVFVLAYVSNRAIQNRLDNVFGPFGWKNYFKEWKNENQLCGISVKHEGEWITKWDGSDNSNMDAVKGGLSNSMKRAAVEWGIGRYLYNLEQHRVPLKSNGQNYASVKVKVDGKEEYIKGYWDEPNLPSWALPEGFKYEPKTTTPETHINSSMNAPEAKIKQSLNDPNAVVIPICPKCNKPLAETEKEAAAIIDYCNKYKKGDIACRTCQKQK